MDIDTLQGLRRCPLFNGLTESEIIDLMHTVRYRVVRCCKGEFHAIEGSVCQYADIIIQGEMVASMMGSSGRIIRVAVHQSGKLLAPAFFFASDNQYPVTIEATADTTVFRLMPADLENILSHDPRLMMNYIKILSNVVSQLTKKVRMLSMSVREKVILYLEEQIKLQQSKDVLLPFSQSKDVLLPFSRQELADHFGIQKYSLQRCLNELKQEGAILVEGRHVKVLSLKAHLRR